MNKKIENIVKYLQEQNIKVVEITKSNYTLENGDVFEHTFEIDENISVEEFQKFLNNAKTAMVDIIKNIEKINE